MCQEDGKTAQREACAKESDETVERDPAGNVPARIVVDEDVFEVWPRGRQFNEVVVCQVDRLLEVDFRGMEVAKSPTGVQVVIGESVVE